MSKREKLKKTPAGNVTLYEVTTSMFLTTDQASGEIDGVAPTWLADEP